MSIIKINDALSKGFIDSEFTPLIQILDINYRKHIDIPINISNLFVSRLFKLVNKYALGFNNYDLYNTAVFFIR